MGMKEICLLVFAVIVVVGVVKLVAITRENHGREDRHVHTAVPSASAGAAHMGSSNPLLPPNHAPEGRGTGTVVYLANGNARDNVFLFNYRYVYVSGSWRAYIERMPDLQGRDASGHKTHRLWDGDKPYVCWDTPVSTLEDMQTVSKVWGDNIIRYIRTGQTF